MSTTSIDRLLERYHYPLLDADNYDNFAYGAEHSVLFFPGDPAQFAESNDVAVILPELLKSCNTRLQPAVVDRSIERELQQRFRFTRWPALVFLQRGEYLGALSGILDWHDYITQIAQILASPPSRPPAFDLDRVCNPVH